MSGFIPKYVLKISLLYIHYCKIQVLSMFKHQSFVTKNKTIQQPFNHSEYA